LVNDFQWPRGLARGSPSGGIRWEYGARSLRGRVMELPWASALPLAAAKKTARKEERMVMASSGART